jgi:hypothetical protein
MPSLRAAGEAIQYTLAAPGLPRRCAPRNDAADSTQKQRALIAVFSKVLERGAHAVLRAERRSTYLNLGRLICFQVMPPEGRML